MDLAFADLRLEQLCASFSMLSKHVGERSAKAAAAQLASLRAAPCLAEFRHLPGRCREQDDSLVLEISESQELVFEPTDDPPPITDEGTLDWTAVRSIRVLAVSQSKTPTRR